ncbi:MAG TPA: cytochrome c assembly protein, partial [Chitinophagaceae bacterium]
LVPTIISVVLSLCISIFGGVNYSDHGAGFLFAIHLALFSAVYAIVANAGYIWIASKKLRSSGASIAHIGFGMILLGILISSSKKTVLSNNTTGIALFQKQKGGEDPAENITLFKGQATDMGEYMVTYVNDYMNARDRKRYYEIRFAPKDGSKGFTLYPDVIKNNKGEGFSANPDSKHYLHKDIFAYLTSFQEGKKGDTASFRPNEISVGDTIFYSNGRLALNNVSLNPAGTKYNYGPGDSLLVMDVTVMANEGNYYKAFPAIEISNGNIIPRPDTVKAQSLEMQFNRVIDQDKRTLELLLRESKDTLDLVTLKVYEFPLISVLWLGVIVMFVGFIISVIHRVRQFRETRLIKK